MTDLIEKILIKQRIDIIQRRNSYIGVLRRDSKNALAIRKIDELTYKLNEINDALTLKKGDNHVAIKR